MGKIGGGRQVSMTTIALNIVKGSYLYVIPTSRPPPKRLLYAKDGKGGWVICGLKLPSVKVLQTPNATAGPCQCFPGQLRSTPKNTTQDKTQLSQRRHRQRLETCNRAVCFRQTAQVECGDSALTRPPALLENHRKRNIVPPRPGRRRRPNRMGRERRRRIPIGSPVRRGDRRTKPRCQMSRRHLDRPPWVNPQLRMRCRSSQSRLVTL
jgi:hypothetical protein